MPPEIAAVAMDAVTTCLFASETRHRWQNATDKQSDLATIASYHFARRSAPI